MTAFDEVFDSNIEKLSTAKASIIYINSLKKEGDHGKALKACLKALEFYPDESNLIKMLAEIYFEQGFYGLAETEIENLHCVINELVDIYKLQAELYKKGNRIEEAITSIELYLAHHENDQEAVQFLSELREPAVEEEPSSFATPTLAEMYFEQGEIEEAIKTYEELVRNSPDDEKSRARLEELLAFVEAEKQRVFSLERLKERKLKLLRVFEAWLAAVERRKALRT